MVWTYPDDLPMYDTHQRVTEDNVKNRNTSNIDYVISAVQTELDAFPEEHPPSLEWVELDSLLACLVRLPIEAE